MVHGKLPFEASQVITYTLKTTTEIATITEAVASTTTSSKAIFLKESYIFIFFNKTTFVQFLLRVHGMTGICSAFFYSTDKEHTITDIVNMTYF